MAELYTVMARVISQKGTCAAGNQQYPIFEHKFPHEITSVHIPYWIER